MNLKEIRKRNKLTQQDVAKHLKITQATYSGYESEKFEPTTKTLIELANLYNVTLDELMGNEKKEGSLSPEKASLLKTIESLNEIECHKLNVFAQGLIMNRNFEQKERTLKIIKNIEEEK